MKGRVQKILQDNYQSNDRLELKDNSGVQTFIGITENNIMSFSASEYGLLEQILSPTNLNSAFNLN